jgi:hypothetical protein
MSTLMKHDLLWRDCSSTTRLAHGLRFAAVIALIILPALLTLVYIRTYGVNVPYWDQWEIVSLFEQWYTGNLSFMHLFSQHNEHRIFLPRVFMLLLGNMTHYNTLAEMYFSWVLLCLTCIILFIAYVHTVKTTWSELAKFILVAWLIFGLQQYENLLWGWQLQWFLAALCIVFAIYFIE